MSRGGKRLRAGIGRLPKTPGKPFVTSLPQGRSGSTEIVPIKAGCAGSTRVSGAIRHLAIATYILIRLIQGVIFGSLAKYAVLGTTPGKSGKSYRLLGATVGTVKVLHVGLTALAVLYLLHPRRLAVLSVTTITVFLCLLGLLVWRCVSGVDGGDLIDTPFTVAAILLATLLQAMDACMDAIAREQKVYLQGARKAASAFNSLCAIVQLWLPGAWMWLPPVFVASIALSLSVWVACQWAQSSHDLTHHLHIATESAGQRFLSWRDFCFFLLTCIIGANGEKILDALTNISIDMAVAGGNVLAATAKESVAAGANLVTFLTIFVANYRARFRGEESLIARSQRDADDRLDEAEGSNSDDNCIDVNTIREIRIALRVLIIWAAVQVPRLAANKWSQGDGTALPTLVLVALVAADKLSGNLVEDALGAIESYWLEAKARPPNLLLTNTAQPGVACGFVSRVAAVGALLAAPIACQSISEVLDTLSGAWIKHLIDAGDANGGAAGVTPMFGRWMRRNVTFSVGALIALAVVTHWKMARAALVSVQRGRGKSQ